MIVRPAKSTKSQLSQPPTNKKTALGKAADQPVGDWNWIGVGVEGFEPPASCSQSRRATKLRYTPKS